MGAFLKKIVIIAIVLAIGWFIMAHHFIIIDRSVGILKKEKLTLQYTIFSTKGKEIDKVMSIPVLWDDGIGELLLEKGKITEDQLEAFKVKMEEEEDYY